MKKFFAGFCAAAIAAGCMGMTAVADTEATDKPTSYEATSDNVKLIGRTYRKGDTTILGYSASGIEFKCTGTKAVFNVNGSVGEARIGVFVNGKLVKQGYIKNKKTNAVEKSGNPLMAIRAAGTVGSINRPTKYCGQYVKSSATTVPHAMAVSKAMRSVAATRLCSPAPKL